MLNKVTERAGTKAMMQRCLFRGVDDLLRVFKQIFDIRDATLLECWQGPCRAILADTENGTTRSFFVLAVEICWATQKASVDTPVQSKPTWFS